jgi:hypothetical protein
VWHKEIDMNERIRELADQALKECDAAKERGIDQYSKRFAELIVKECMDIVSKQTTLDTNEDFREGFSHGRKLAWTEIRKHFGVEE